MTPHLRSKRGHVTLPRGHLATRVGAGAMIAMAALTSGCAGSVRGLVTVASPAGPVRSASAVVTSTTASPTTQPTATVFVEPNAPQGSVGGLLGANLDWRSDTEGVWNATAGVPEPATTGLLDAIHLSSVRFPGGILSNSYRWRDGVGPISQRKPQAYNDQATDVDRFGTDEFMTEVAALRSQALITVDPCGAPTPSSCHQQGASAVTPNCPAPPSDCPGAADAADWVRYLNDPPSTPLGHQRALNGHRSAYHVHLFELGNELYDYGITPTQYQALVSAYAAAMRGADPGIKLIVAAQVDNTGGGPWLDAVLGMPAGMVDFVAPHLYGPGEDGHSAVFLDSTTTRTTSFQVGSQGAVAVKLSAVHTGPAIPAIQVSVDGAPLGTVTAAGACYACSIGGPGAQYQSLPVSLAGGTHTLSMTCSGCGSGTAGMVIGALAQGPTSFAAIALSDLSAAGFEKVIYGDAKLLDNVLGGINYNRAIRHSATGVYITEWGSIYGQVEDWAPQIEDMASTVWEDAMVQIMLRQGVAGASFWHVNNYHFHLVHPESSTYALPGWLFKILAGRLFGTVVGTGVAGATFSAPAGQTLPPQPQVEQVQAQATRHGQVVELQIVNLGEAGCTVVVATDAPTTGAGEITGVAATSATTADDLGHPASVVPTTRAVHVSHDTRLWLPARSASLMTYVLA